MVVRGHVKWFDTTKGYGFVVGDDGEGDILLHSNVLRVFGFTSVAEGAEISLRVQSTDRGRQAVEVLDIVPTAPAAAQIQIPLPEGDAAGPLEPARVKWFDRVKGFGFVNVYGRPEGLRGAELGLRDAPADAGLMPPARRVAALAVAAVLAAGAGHAADCAPDQVDLRADGSALRFHVEVMDTAAGREKGLMFRESLPKFSGMLFVYEEPQPVAFWMRNTLIPLDILFFDAAGRLERIAANARPHDETPLFGGNDIQYVLEINGGLAAELGIAPGAEIRNPAIAGGAWSCDD
jgi:uncharacterized membrane protein (UPF0127 family)/cold shock CspA family protein